MKIKFRRGLIVLAAVALLCARALALPEALVPVGRTVGIHLLCEPVVVGFELRSSARDAGVRVGDCIVSVDGERICSAGELRSRIGPEDLCLGVTRDGDYLEFAMTPAETDAGARLGLRLRDGISGIGTVTFYDPASGRYGALGHCVNDPGSGLPAGIFGGDILSAEVTEAVPGRPGRPGELRARFPGTEPIGTIDCNGAAGIFGELQPPEQVRALPLAPAAQVREAPAQILSNVEGTEVRPFDIEILKTDPENSLGRNFLLRICDEALLACTGGIVQGMSGSPIVQDGRLVGAVTHVLVDDPTLGYGISIETMLRQAQPASDDAGLHQAVIRPPYKKTFCELRKNLLSKRHNYYRIGGKQA